MARTDNGPVQSWSDETKSLETTSGAGPGNPTTPGSSVPYADTSMTTRDIPADVIRQTNLIDSDSIAGSAFGINAPMGGNPDTSSSAGKPR